MDVRLSPWQTCSDIQRGSAITHLREYALGLSSGVNREPVGAFIQA
jgi:hypothetical protein